MQKISKKLLRLKRTFKRLKKEWQNKGDYEGAGYACQQVQTKDEIFSKTVQAIDCVIPNKTNDEEQKKYIPLSSLLFPTNK